MKRLTAHPRKARIEIIPLIDVIFFLLATFVLVSLSMTRLQGLETTFPNTAPKDLQTAEIETIQVLVLADGNCQWDDRVMSEEQLIARMAQYRRESPDPRILINGQEGARFGQAIAVLDNARALGIEKVSIKTKL
jgi:biopolymer transport protein ExbD